MNAEYINGHPHNSGFPAGFQGDASRESDASSRDAYYPEKRPQSKKSSKSYMFRMFRLGTSIALTIGVLVLTLIILISGRHGGGSNDLSLVRIDMSNFARFNPPQINLVDTNDATKTRRGIFDDIGDKVGDAVDSVETFASGAASKVESAAGAVATAAEAKADEIIGEIGDALDDLENAVTGLMEKILGTIQDALNKWLKEAANALGDIDIPRTMSLHLTTYCSGNDTLTGSNSTDSNSTSTSVSCTRLFSSGESSFNETENNGTIFGFQPGAVLAKALGVFYVPEGAQLAIREPVDNGVNTVDRLVHKAGAELSSWTVNLLFIPIVVVYVMATVFGFLLLIILLGATYLCYKDHEKVDAKIFGLCGVFAAGSAFFLLLGSIILTVIGLVAYVVGLGAGVIDITVESSSQLKWMSWAAFIIMALLAISLKVQEFVANVKSWFEILTMIFTGKSKETSKDPEKHSGNPQHPH